MAKITGETVIADIITVAPEAAEVFMQSGMGCIGCAMASGETVAEACDVHGIDCEELLVKLNAVIK